MENAGPNEEFAYLEKYNQNSYKIPTCFKYCAFLPCKLFQTRITQIYDPSKFWMVVKFKELEVYTKYLFRFYYQNHKYRIPKDKIRLEMYCVAFADGGYYRGKISGFPCDHEKECKVQIYFIDYAMFQTVDVSNLFYMDEKSYQVPQFVVRASLANICPHSTSRWTGDSVTEFHKRVNNEVLTGVVVNVDAEREVVSVHLTVTDEIDGDPIHKTLIEKEHAIYVYDRVKRDQKKPQPNVKYPYLFPSHVAIESGKVPSSLSDLEYQLQVGGQSSAFSWYFDNKEGTR